MKESLMNKETAEKVLRDLYEEPDQPSSHNWIPVVTDESNKIYLGLAFYSKCVDCGIEITIKDPDDFDIDGERYSSDLLIPNCEEQQELLLEEAMDIAIA